MPRIIRVRPGTKEHLIREADSEPAGPRNLYHHRAELPSHAVGEEAKGIVGAEVVSGVEVGERFDDGEALFGVGGEVELGGERTFGEDPEDDGAFGDEA